jgi:hypothetical protein
VRSWHLAVGLAIGFWAAQAPADDTLLHRVKELAACGAVPCDPLRNSPILAAREHPPWHAIDKAVQAPWCPPTCAVAKVWVTRLPDGEFVKVACCLAPAELQLIAP